MKKTFRCQVCGREYKKLPANMTCKDQACGGPVVEKEEKE